VSGFVSIVGAGPWDPELLTLAGRDRLAGADVVVADYLVNPALLLHCKAGTEIVQRMSGPHADSRIDQDDIHRLLVEHARAGRYVVRIKGGDPCMFGRGAEEAQYLRAHGIAFELVPGVSSAIAAPESAGIPVTHRDYTPAVTIVSGYEAYEKAGLAVEWEHLARSAGTIVLMMSMKNCRDNASKLVAAGRSADTPAAVIRWGTRGIQHTIVGTLLDIADRVDRAKMRAPAVMVVGEVVRCREHMDWFEQLPLFGRRIVVTRANHQASGLVGLLARQGADVVPFPCLELAAPPDPTAASHALVARDRFDGILLSSPNGVRACFEALAQANLDVRALAGKLVAVVGTGTSEACRQYGLRPDVLPSTARAEGLVNVMREHGLLEKRWLHLRADEGRDVLARAIVAAGGDYQLVVAYRTIRPKVPELLLASLGPPERGGERVDAICFASGKTARHMLESLSDAFGRHEAHAIVGHAKTIALGPVTAAAVAALGISVTAVASEPSDEGMLRAVMDAFPPPT